jgi:hypothetical protein
MRKIAIVTLICLSLLGCGSSVTKWGDFQSRVLDTMDRYKKSELGDADLLRYLHEEQKWAQSITAEACYDPALRADRDFLDALIKANSKIPVGVPLDQVSLTDLTAARDALKDAISESDRLSALMLLATGACK